MDNDKTINAINAELDTHLLRQLFLHDYWHKNVLLVQKKGKLLVFYPPCKSWLRHSTGPWQHYYWDMHGDDFKNNVMALNAISQAPAPKKQYIEVKSEENSDKK